MTKFKDGTKEWQNLRRLGDTMVYGYSFACTKEDKMVDHKLDEVLRDAAVRIIDESKDDIVKHAQDLAIEKAKEAVEKTGVFDKITVGVSPASLENDYVKSEKEDAVEDTPMEELELQYTELPAAKIGQVNMRNTSKPGLQTTEFWVTIGTQVVGILAALGTFTSAQSAQALAALEPTVGLIMMVVSAIGYAVSRGIAKKNDNYAE